jgi:hypothetical protein
MYFVQIQIEKLQEFHSIVVEIPELHQYTHC